MRVVLDTNVLVRSTPVSIGGPAWEVLDLLSRGGHALVLSAPLLSELADVLQRPRFQAVVGLNSEQAIRFVVGLEKAAEIIDLSGAPAVEIPHDPKDIPVVLTAIAGRAEVICTLDRHLLHPRVVAVCQANGIRVLSDIELLNELRHAERGKVRPPLPSNRSACGIMGYENLTARESCRSFSPGYGVLRVEWIKTQKKGA